MSDPDEVLRSVAASQGGPFTRAQALAAGRTPRQIRTLLRDGAWTSLTRGVHVETALLAGPPERRHVVLAAGRVLASGLDVVASHRTAALLHGLPLLGRPPDLPQLTRAPRWSGDQADHPGVRVAQLPTGSVTVVGGVPVTSVPRTVCDVGRTASFREGLVPADAALRAGLDPAELQAEARRCSGWPGARTAAAVAAFADGRAETPLESLTRAAYAEQGLPAPETQVELYAPDGSFVALVDFLWREQRTVGEADGLGKYDQPGVGRREKQRELAILRCGFEVVPNGWDDAWLTGPRQVLAEHVRETFDVAARRPAVAGVSVRRPGLDELRRRTAAWGGAA